MKQQPRMFLHALAVLTALWTLFVLVAGAMVTSTGSGLSVPDWPLSFGGLFPEMVGGVFYEHGHRVVAFIAGCLIIGMVVASHRMDERPGLRRLAWAALGVVVLQGMLGGLTVLLRLPTAVSSAHALLAQATFCLTVSMALMTAPAWRRWSDAGPLDVGGYRSLAIFVALAVYVQIGLGAVIRHLGAGLAIPDFPLAYGYIIPPPHLWGTGVGLNLLHRLGAFVILLLTLILVGALVRLYGHHKPLAVAAIAQGLLVTLQVVLGAAVIFTGKLPQVTAAHLATGALVLASSLTTVLMVVRPTLRGATPPAPPAPQFGVAVAR